MKKVVLVFIEFLQNRFIYRIGSF